MRAVRIAEKPFIVGLTGGIGSGKSTVADRFGRLGVAIVDTDLIAHQLTAAKGAAMPAIAAAFGDEVITADGSMDREAMRERAFSDPASRQRLERILHPMIRAESDRQCRLADSPYVILAVPLLIESGTYRQRCNRICVVDCRPETQIERVRRRSQLSDERILSIIAAQVDRATRLAAADDVIDNEGGIDRLDQQVAALHERYLAMADTLRGKTDD